jgi:two-component system sensor histidine kinase/response regulator
MSESMVFPPGPKSCAGNGNGNGSVSSPVSILIVDDNSAKRLALKAALSPLGYSIVEADSGLAALRCVMAQDFAVILLDVCMPILDGPETAAIIRQRPQSEMTPIIFITAFGSDEIVSTDHYAEGAVDFIFAPVPPEELRAKVSVFANIFLKAEDLAVRARKVQTSADQWKLLSDAAPIGIFQTDNEKNYVYTNPRWSEITGILPDAAAGLPWDAIIDPAQRANLAATLPRSEFSLRFEIRFADLAPRIVQLTSKAVREANGDTAGWVGTLADVTTEAGAEAAMSEARDEATASSRLKSDFLANMSHEIRTPMNGVIGMTDLLLETDLDPRQRDYAQTVRNSGEALLAIINDILDFSKVEAGMLEVESIPFALRTIVDDVVDLLARPAQAKGLELLAVVEKSLPGVVRGDPSRVRQVLTNLVGNALKFTQTGEIVVRVTAAPASDTIPNGLPDADPIRPTAGGNGSTGEDANRSNGSNGTNDGTTAAEQHGPDIVVHFEVSDTGDGIAADKVDEVFQPFVQVDTSTSRRYGGTGLGLAISSQLVALMGGDCGVTSTLGSGSTFWFTIRVHALAGQATSELLSPASGLTGINALIVSDNATLRTVLSQYLTDWGMTVGTADSGHSALSMLRTAAVQNRPFAVALLDWSMPGTDGLELTNAIVVDQALTARLVHMTALGHEGDIGGVVQGGISASLPKPVHREDLRRALRVALGLQQADVGSPEISTLAPAPIDGPEMGRLLLAEDNLINQKVAVEMLSSAGYRVDTVLNGAAAVQAVASRPYDAILMDCQMPELNGYEATAAIRALKSSGRLTPIIAMTAGARHEDRERCLAEGMDGYLAKPVSKETLLALVARSVKDSAGIIDPQPKLGYNSIDDDTIDPDVFEELRLLGEATNEDFLAELVGQFVKVTEPLLLELGAALETGDRDAVVRIAHSIRGSGDQLGGRRLALSCLRLEEKAKTCCLADGQTDLQEVEFDYQDLCRTLIHQLASTDRQRSRGPRV